MIELTIRFSFQESHKLAGNLSYREKKFTFKNEDEKEGFLRGLNAAIGTVYLEYEVK